MSEHQFRFDESAAYERMMGTWSRLVGDVFLDWLSPRPGLRWIDVGCGNGAFTEQLIERCAPSEVVGRRAFPDFDDFLVITRSATPALSAAVDCVTDAEQLRTHIRQRLSVDADGRITYAARANAVKGRVPT